MSGETAKKWDTCSEMNPTIHLIRYLSLGKK